MENKNMEIYNSFAEVPANAKKTISAGRLKGMTDINPMWRIKMLTEKYGACGTGWYYDITDKQVVEGAGGVICVFLDIKLYVKENGVLTMDNLAKYTDTTELLRWINP